MWRFCVHSVQHRNKILYKLVSIKLQFACVFHLLFDGYFLLVSTMELTFFPFRVQKFTLFCGHFQACHLSSSQIVFQATWIVRQMSENPSNWNVRTWHTQWRVCDACRNAETGLQFLACVFLLAWHHRRQKRRSHNTISAAYACLTWTKLSISLQAAETCGFAATDQRRLFVLLLLSVCVIIASLIRGILKLYLIFIWSSASMSAAPCESD